MNYDIVKPSVKFEGLDTKSVLKAWVASRSRFLSIDEERKLVINNETNEVFPIDGYVKDVLHMDTAFSYFETGTFVMKTSVLLRDFFYTFQECKGKWATTQRYGTQRTMTCSSECKNLPHTQEAFDLFIQMTNDYNAGKLSQFDDVRECMPLGYQVSWQMSMPIKQFIKYMAVLYTLVGPNSTIWKEFYAACYQDESVRPWLKNILKYLDCDEISKYDETQLQSLYNGHHPYEELGKVGCVLYSQLIRHEGTMTAGYFNFIKKLAAGNRSELPNCKSEFDLWVYQTPKRKQEMLKVRTEWFAVTDNWESNNTWAKFLRRYLKDGDQIEDHKDMFTMFDSNGEFRQDLISKYNVDDSLRLHKGYNAYFPNPFVLECRDIVLQRIARYGDNPLMQMYLQLFDHGYVKDNPDNPYRKKWEELNK